MPAPGPRNAITDVPGVLVGQVERTDPPYLTGTTVVHVPGPPSAGSTSAVAHPAPVRPTCSTR